MTQAGLAYRSLRAVYRATGLSQARRRVSATRWYFDRVLDDYAQRHPMNASGGSDDPILAALLSDGMVILPAYHDAEKIRALHDKLLPMLEQIRARTPDPAWKTLEYREDGIYRLLDAVDLVPELSLILDDARLTEVARRYLGGTLRAVSHYVDYKPDLVHDYTSQLHMDSWQSQVKIFTLLCDVDEARAPMVYWKGSHKDGAWRRRFDYAYWQGDEVGTAGLFPAGVLRRVAKEEGTMAEVTVTGKAGTVVIADTRGVHRASNLRDQYRLEVVQKFSQPVIG